MRKHCKRSFTSVNYSDRHRNAIKLEENNFKKLNLNE
jgi:hypothetical protein